MHVYPGIPLVFNIFISLFISFFFPFLFIIGFIRLWQWRENGTAVKEMACQIKTKTTAADVCK